MVKDTTNWVTTVMKLATVYVISLMPGQVRQPPWEMYKESTGDHNERGLTGAGYLGRQDMINRGPAKDKGQVEDGEKGRGANLGPFARVGSGAQAANGEVAGALDGGSNDQVGPTQASS